MFNFTSTKFHAFYIFEFSFFAYIVVFYYAHYYLGTETGILVMKLELAVLIWCALGLSSIQLIEINA